MIATLKALSIDPSIVILKPDKGNGVVILNKADYEYKINTIIQDCPEFTLINDNDWFKRMLKHEDQVSRYLYKLCQEIIDKPLYDHLHLSSSHPGILYGLPKIHKMSIPLRPILSSIGTCGYKIAKFLVPILNLSLPTTLLSGIPLPLLQKFLNLKTATNMSWLALILSLFS